MSNLGTNLWDVPEFLWSQTTEPRARTRGGNSNAKKVESQTASEEVEIKWETREKDGGNALLQMSDVVLTEAGRKVEKTVSITPGTHQRIICPGWVNCDLRSVMICNNFLSLLSVSRQGRSAVQAAACMGGKTRKWMPSQQMRGDAACNVGSPNYNQINYRCIRMCMSGDAAGESELYSRLQHRHVKHFIIYQLRKMRANPQWEPRLASAMTRSETGL